MSEPWNSEIDDLRSRLSDLIERTDLADDARELAAEALEELAVVMEEMQTQNAELLSSQSDVEDERRRYRDLFETVPDGYLVTDSRGMIREVNATACNLFGQNRDLLVDKPLAAYIAEGDQRAYYANLARINSAGVGSHLSLNLMIKDHITLPGNLRATVAQSAVDGETEIRWLIHDRRGEIATEELRSSEDRLRAMFDTAGVGIMLCDTDGQIVFCNRQADHILRRGPNDIVLSDWSRAIHADDKPELDELIGLALVEGISGALRHRLHTDESIERWAEHTIVPFIGAKGTIDGFISTLADVTAEHIALIRLQESRDFTAAVVDTVGALVVVLDREARIQGFNKACETVTGFTAAEVIGKPVVELLVPEDQSPAVEQVFASVLSLRALANGPVRFENEWVTADGSRRLIAWTNTALVEENGDITTVIGTGIAVTDQRLLESRLAQADRLDSVGLLAAGIAHDFNNTLGTLLLRIGRLQGRDLDADSQRDVAEAQATIHRTQSLISDLLSFSRIQELTPTEVDVNQACWAASALLGELLGPTIAIDLVLTDDDTTAHIDAARFDQVLTNLAINARDAMPDGGTITLTTTITDIIATDIPNHTSPPKLQPGSYVRLTVADTGSGIDAADLPVVFDPYFTTKPPARGTGLGLATTYGTINQSGGAITVDSEPGVGTTFTLWIPQTNRTTTSTSTRSSTTTTLPSGARRGRRVLVVDDDSELRRTLVAELQAQDYATLEAIDGADATDYLDMPIDVLVTDIQLPGIDGIELAARFRREQPGISIIFISGALTNQVRNRLPQDAGVLAKPFDSATLITTLRKATGEGMMTP